MIALMTAVTGVTETKAQQIGPSCEASGNTISWLQENYEVLNVNMSNQMALEISKYRSSIG